MHPPYRVGYRCNSLAFEDAILEDNGHTTVFINGHADDVNLDGIGCHTLTDEAKRVGVVDLVGALTDDVDAFMGHTNPAIGRASR